MNTRGLVELIALNVAKELVRILHPWNGLMNFSQSHLCSRDLHTGDLERAAVHDDGCHGHCDHGSDWTAVLVDLDTSPTQIDETRFRALTPPAPHRRQLFDA